MHAVSRNAGGRHQRGDRGPRRMAASVVAATLMSLTLLAPASASDGERGRKARVTPAEAAAIAAEAYIYGYPMVQEHKIYWLGLTFSFIQEGFDFNVCASVGDVRLLTPEDTVVVTPNNDTPYAGCLMDLRSQPQVLSVPPIDEDRYYSFQCLDYFTNNWFYIGSRTTGNDGGDFLIIGPENKPIDRRIRRQFTDVFESPSNIMLCLARTQLFCRDNDGDCLIGLAEVRRIVDQYDLTPLSKWPIRNTPRPKPVRPLKLQPALFVGGGDIFPNPALGSFFRVLNWGLTNAQPPFAQDAEKITRFEKIFVGPGEKFKFSKFTPLQLIAMQAAIIKANNELTETAENPELIDGWNLFPVDKPYFCTPPACDNTNYDFRAEAARAAIWVNDPEEALYYFGRTDSDGFLLDTGNANYAVTFPGEADLPPAEFFWSLTMYGADRFLVDNCIKRYTIDSNDVLDVDRDGSISLIFSREPPDGTNCTDNVDPNWLPAPDGEFYVVLRIYGPIETDPPYFPPGIERLFGESGGEVIVIRPTGINPNASIRFTQPFP